MDQLSSNRLIEYIGTFLLHVLERLSHLMVLWNSAPYKALLKGLVSAALNPQRYRFDDSTPAASMSHPSAPKNVEDLQSFDFQKILNEDPLSHSLTILGSLGGSQAIIRIEKAALDVNEAPGLFCKDGSLIQRADLVQSTDIVCGLPWFATTD